MYTRSILMQQSAISSQFPQHSQNSVRQFCHLGGRQIQSRLLSKGFKIESTYLLPHFSFCLLYIYFCKKSMWKWGLFSFVCWFNIYLCFVPTSKIPFPDLSLRSENGIIHAICLYFSRVANPPRICRSDLLTSSTCRACLARVGSICMSRSVTSLCTVVTIWNGIFRSCFTITCIAFCVLNQHIFI